MKCITGVGLSAAGVLASSSAQLTVTPSETSAAAAAETSGVTKFSVPRSSSGPQRPQLDSACAIASTSARVPV